MLKSEPMINGTRIINFTVPEERLVSSFVPAYLRPERRAQAITGIIEHIQKIAGVKSVAESTNPAVTGIITCTSDAVTRVITHLGHMEYRYDIV